jgi:anti-sigma B factor antagonist
MISLSSADDAAGVLQVAGELTVYHAAALATDLLARIAETAGPDVDLALDLDGVTELDSAGLQVLMVARRELRARGGQLRLQRPSRPVRDILETFALHGWLEAPPAPAAAAPSGPAEADPASPEDVDAPDTTLPLCDPTDNEGSEP